MMAQSVGTYLLVSLLSIFVMWRMRVVHATRRGHAIKEDYSKDLTEAAIQLSKKLAVAMPGSVIAPEDNEAFTASMKAHWAKQASEMVPACAIQPRDTEALSTAVKILKQEYDDRRSKHGKLDPTGLFAIRSGGHSPVAGAASMKGGVIIDLRHFNEVIPSEDEKSVLLGVGARWGDVYRILDRRGLAVSGGRNSDVGVGGLVLGGGLSFFAPRHGLVCNNIYSYEVVLASGKIVTATASQHSGLWCALKGGGNNFGVVTRVRARCFSGTDIWSGFLYMPMSNASKVLALFHDFLNRKMSKDVSSAYDEFAAGPMACFTYLQQTGITAISVNLAYTKLPEKKNEWPNCWKSSGMKSMWRYWSTCKTRTLTSATEEMNALAPAGRRQMNGTTTYQNDRETNDAIYAIFMDGIAQIKKANVRGMSWTLVLQPFLPQWCRKGDPNPLGLDQGDEPLVNAQLSVNWLDSTHDAFVRTLSKNTIEAMEAYTKARGTAHPYKYLNYCSDLQNPFEGYGEKNVKFLQRISEEYDPDALFQKGCVGGFKLPRWEAQK